MTPVKPTSNVKTPTSTWDVTWESMWQDDRKGCRRITERMVPDDRNTDNADYAGLLHQQMYRWPDCRSHLQDLNEDLTTGFRH